MTSGRAAVVKAHTIASAIRAVLLTADPYEKALAARAVGRGWRSGRLAHRLDVAMPDRPARPDRPALLPPNRMPKRGRMGSERGRIAMLHALAHIEYVAIDLALDCAGRFGDGLPRAFVDDWLGVAADEAMHFVLLDRRLRTFGARYGDLPAHDGLWEAAEKTRDDLSSRLAMVPMALEARGLDVTPMMVMRFDAAGDVRSARVLSRIYADEIRHVAIGTRWFESGCKAAGQDAVSEWRRLLSSLSNGLVKPPFNDSARQAAGLTLDYYDKLAATNGHTSDTLSRLREGHLTNGTS